MDLMGFEKAILVPVTVIGIGPLASTLKIQYGMNVLYRPAPAVQLLHRS